MLERVKNGNIVVVDTETVKEYIDKGYECIDNHILMVYKIRDTKGGKRKTLKKLIKNR
jgi:hypothetical protein